MHEHGESSDSPVAKSALRIAIVVFAGLGILELVVAASFHKVALGVDGAHNLVDGVVYLVNLKAQDWAKFNQRSFWTCKAEPGAPLFTSGVVVVSAFAFTIFESTLGAGTETHQGLALALLLASFMTNGIYVAVIYGDRQKQMRRQGRHDRHMRNVLVHAFWDMISTLLSVIGYILIAAGLTNLLDPVSAWIGTMMILWGHRKEIPDAWREIRGHQTDGHSHPLAPHHRGPHESGHAH